MNYEPVDLAPTIPWSGQSTYAAIQITLEEVAKPVLPKLIIGLWNELLTPVLNLREELTHAMGMKMMQSQKDLPRHLVSLRNEVQRTMPPDNIDWIQKHFARPSIESRFWEKLYPESLSGDWIDAAGVLMVQDLQFYEGA